MYSYLFKNREIIKKTIIIAAPIIFEIGLNLLAKHKERKLGKIKEVNYGN
jgi:hypothetical protein